MSKTRTTSSQASQNRHYSVRLDVFLLIFLMPLSGLSKEGTIQYRQRVRLGADMVNFDNTCVFFTASMTAGDFFDGLRRIKTPTGAEFRKGSSVVDHFPEKISVEIRGVVTKCSENPREVLVPGLAADFMSSLRFEAQWGRGSEFQPAENLSAQTSPRPLSKLKNIWTYTVTIPSKDVPLTDHLVVSVLSKEGKKVTRFSARL